MTLLSDRAKKSEKLEFNYIPGTIEAAYGTVSPDSGNHYQVFLMRHRGMSVVDEQQILHDIITTECHCNVGNGRTTDCKGNSRYTICYHCLGAIRWHLSLNNCKIAFCADIFDAILLRKLDKTQTLVKIVSGQDGGKLWGVVGDAKDKCITCGRVLKNRDANCADCSKCANIRVGKMLDLEERAILLRGPEDEQNGID